MENGNGEPVVVVDVGGGNVDNENIVVEAIVHNSEGANHGTGDVQSMSSGARLNMAANTALPSVSFSDSISQRESRHSNSSNRSSLYRKEAADKAELVEKQRLLKSKQQMEKQKLELRIKREQEDLILRQREEELELLGKLAISDARSKALTTIEEVVDDEITFRLPREPVNLIDRISLNPAVGDDPQPPVSDFQPKLISTSSQNINTVDQTQLNDIVHSLRKPVIDVKKFGGNPLDYGKFMRQLNSVVLVHCSSYEDKMNALEMYTYGQPQEIVSSYSYLEAERGFNTAMSELKERYGHPDVVASAFVNKALGWDVIKPNDSVSFDKFSVFMSECLHALSSYNNLNTLNNSGNIQTLVRILPTYIQDRWRTHVKKQEDNRRTILFEHFATFIKEESKKINHPIYGKEALNSVKSTPQPVKTKHVVSSNYSKKNFSVSTTEKSDLEIKCQHCHEKHFIGECGKLSKLSHDDILSIVSKERLCFGCLKFGHQRNKCWKRLKCAKCDFKHPTLLHSETKPKYEKPKSDQKEQSCHICAHTEAGNGLCTLPILPCIVKHGNKTVKTYAFHDCGSSVCFCTTSLLQKLGASGPSKSITIETMSSSKTVQSTEVKNLEVFNLDLSGSVNIPSCFSINEIPASKDHIPTAKDIDKYPHLNCVEIPEVNEDIGLLIGNNIPDAFTPLRIVKGELGTPHASKTILGWVLYNVIRPNGNTSYKCHAGKVFVNRISTEIERTNQLDKLMRNALNFDFPERLIDDKRENSILDDLFISKVNDSVVKADEHYEVGLPIKSDNVTMPKNYGSCLNRLNSLKTKFHRDSNYKSDYITFMNSMLEKGYAEEVPHDELSLEYDKLWYIPHHGVYHKKKKKIRVVFDCSARHEGFSLNDNLLSGPVILNSLIGVLIRFRLGLVAMMADIEGMFHQIKVPVPDRNSLRYLWWPNGNTSEEPKQYRMTSHIFGAVSSPSIANYILQKTALDNTQQFNNEVIKTVLDNFYVDDCLRSIDGEENAIELADNLIQLLKLGGFRLHKFISNSDSVINSIPVSERANSTSRSFGDSDVILERALGVNWEVKTDTLTFKIDVADKPNTRRGILSVVSSVFDPLGLAAPVLLPAKLLLKDICNQGYSWDQRLDDLILQRWNSWISDLPFLENLSLPRCFKLAQQGEIVSRQLHHFSDASEVGYGVASYLRLVDGRGDISCSLVMGKARVAPLKRITIPRMELTAATLAVKLNSTIVTELKIPIDSVSYWTDSSTVLSYISNESMRYQTFVANRVALIRDATDISQWNFISGKLNPADDASRGLSVKTFLNQNRWFKGPEFLQQPESDWPRLEFSRNIPENDPNVKKVCATVLDENPNHPYEKLMDYYSDFSKLVKAVAWLKLGISNLFKKCFTGDKVSVNKLNVEDISAAELSLIKYEQSKYWKDYLTSDGKSSKGDLAKLDPVVIDDVLRVGGRLNRSELSLDSKHQILIPKKSKLSILLIRQFHVRIGHLGKNSIISESRKTYWIVGAAGLIRDILSKCVSCKRYRADRLVQKMGDLPPHRIVPFQPPFYHTGMDFFGPFELKRGRSVVKRYGAIFTCLNSRAVHLEMAYTMDTDSCVNVIRRFIARRGKPHSILSDNGSNIVSASKELRKGLQEMDQSKISDNLRDKGIKWECNPPAASHFGGAWERLIRQVRKVFSSLLDEQLSRLDDESFITLLCEVEAILNNRPITKNSDSPDDLDALTPNHILQIGSRFDYSVTAPDKTDLYVKRRWRQVQYLSDLFWKRWLHEYVPSLQERHKWLRPKTNVKVGDIVLVVDTGIRNSWSLARVMEVKYDKKGYVRIVTVKTKTSILGV